MVVVVPVVRLTRLPSSSMPRMMPAKLLCFFVLILTSSLFGASVVVVAEGGSTRLNAAHNYEPSHLRPRRVLQGPSSRHWGAVQSLRGGAAASPKARSVKRSPVTNVKNKKPLGTGTATVANEVFNLVKAIVGVGVLSLPAGIAAFSGSRSAIGPSVLIMTAIGLLSAQGFATIGRVCSYTSSASYRQAWSRSVGESTSWIPAYSTTFKTFLACLAFSMVLKDTFTSLLRFDDPPLVLVGVTTVILLPLCSKKSLASLAPFSLLGVLGMAYTFVAMTIRYLDGSYSSSSKTNLLADIATASLRPKFGTTNGWTDVLSPNSLILTCMLSTAFMAHFNAPKFYLELYDNTLPRYHAVVYTSFGISILLMAGMTAMGFLTFGSSSSGLILNNYSPNDVLIFGSRLAVALSLVFSYPLAFQGCRDGILDLLNFSPKQRADDNVVNLTTLVLLSVVTFLAIVLKDVSLVLSLGGATLGNALTYVYPAIMYYSVVKKQKRKETANVALSVVSAVLGIFMGAVGAKMALDK
jgi:amino acid permease